MESGTIADIAGFAGQIRPAGGGGHVTFFPAAFAGEWETLCVDLQVLFRRDEEDASIAVAVEARD